MKSKLKFSFLTDKNTPYINILLIFFPLMLMNQLRIFFFYVRNIEVHLFHCIYNYNHFFELETKEKKNMLYYLIEFV